MRPKPWLLIISAFTLGATILWFHASIAFKPKPLPPPAPPETVTLVPTAASGQPFVTFVDPYKGAPDGDILIVEYGDYACPFCRDMESDLDRLITAHPGRIKLVWKDFPNPLHAGADKGAQAAQCAKLQGKFWEFHDRLMSDVTAFTESRILLLANELELDVEAFMRCFKGEEMKPLIDRSVAEAVALGVDATPYLFIDGQRFSGQMTYEQLEAAVAGP